MGQLILKTKRALYPTFNFLSGVLIRVFNPFRKGDFIEINGFLGSVIHKGYKRTTLKSVEGEEVQIANTLFYTRQLHNLTSHNIVSIDLNIAVSYSEEMANVKHLIIEYLATNSSILKSPSPKIFVKKIRSNHVDLGVKIWCSVDRFLEVDAETEILLKEFLMFRGVELENELLSKDSLKMA